MLYPPLQELAIRFLDWVLVLVIVAGHVKVVWDGRPKANPGQRMIVINGKPAPFQDTELEPRHGS